MDNHEVETKDVVQAAASRGFAVSRAQLHRWRSQGLIPRPTVRGRGRGEGSASFYPIGTDAQVVALCELFKEDRRLDLAALALFFQGYPVSTELLKRILETAADQWEREAGSLANDTGITTPSDVDAPEKRAPGRPKSTPPNGLSALDKVIDGRLNPGPLTRARGRLRKKKFETFSLILFFVAAGKPEHLDEGYGLTGAPSILRRGLGIDGVLAPWMRADDNQLRTAIGSLAAHFNHPALHATVQEADEDSLITSRGELLRVWQALMDLKACFLLLDSKNAFGLQGIPDIDFTHPTVMAPLMLMIWLHLRRMPEVSETIPKVIASAGMVSNLRNLLDSRPRLGKQLAKLMGAALALMTLR